MKNDAGSRKTGAAILRFSILILCIISFFNTANGLKEYVFANNPEIAYSLSFVFQGIIAVMAFKRKEVEEKIKRITDIKEVEEKIKRIEKIADEKMQEWIRIIEEIANEKIANKKIIKAILNFMRKWGLRILKCLSVKLQIKIFRIKKSIFNHLPIIALVIALSMSMLYDYIFIVNSTYSITDNDDTMNYVVAEFTKVRKNLIGYVEPIYKQCNDTVYEKIQDLNTKLMTKSNVGAYKEDWDSYWENKESERPINAMEDVNQIAKSRRSLSETPTPTEIAIMENNTKGKLENIGEYTANTYINSIINSAVILKPNSIQAENIDEICKMMDNTKTKLQDIANAEDYYLNIYNQMSQDNDANNGTTPEPATESTPEPTPEPTPKPTPEPTDKPEEKVKGETIYSMLAIQEMEKYKKQKFDGNKSDKSYESKEEFNWKHGLTEERSKIYAEISLANSLNCKNAAIEIDELKNYYTGIKSDANYNLARLLAKLTGSEIINQSEVDDMISVIGSGLFSNDRSTATPVIQDDDDDLKELKELKNTLELYIPLKNSMVVMRNSNWIDEFDAGNDKDSNDNEESENTTSNNSEDNGDLSENNNDKEKSNKKFNKSKAKEDIDILIQNLSVFQKDIKEQAEMLSNSTMQPSAEPSAKSSTEPSDGSGDVNVVTDAISDLIALEDNYLNEKNSMIKAINRIFSDESDEDKSDEDKSDKDKSDKDKSEIIVPPKKRGLAIFSVIFAVSVDMLSLILGYIVYAWEKRDTKNIKKKLKKIRLNSKQKSIKAPKPIKK